MNHNATPELASSATRSLRGVLATAVTVALLGAASANSAPLQEGGSPLRNGTIGYVMTHKSWSVYETPNKTECPQGMNEGPREQFKTLFMDGKKRSVVEAQLKREGEQWHPTKDAEKFTYLEAKGNVSYGLNLDGKVGPKDFTSPEGEKGIDNQLYRVIGCVAQYRTMGTFKHFEQEFMRAYDDARIVIELTGVEDLINDDDVTVTTYRGSDGLLQDATGEGFIPGGTERVDMRWGKEYMTQLKGKIVNGVLLTKPVDRIMLPWGVTFGTSGYHVFRGFQLSLKLTPENAEGLLAGYVDIEAFNHHLNTSWSTHHHSYGQLSSPSQYKDLYRLADGYPDSTGQNTAISSSVSVKLVQVYVTHPQDAILSGTSAAKNIVSKN